MQLPTISLEQLASLPEIHRLVIPSDYENGNRPMKIRWYLVIYDEAGDATYPMIGLIDEYSRRRVFWVSHSQLAGSLGPLDANRDRVLFSAKYRFVLNFARDYPSHWSELSRSAPAACVGRSACSQPTSRALRIPRSRAFDRSPEPGS